MLWASEKHKDGYNNRENIKKEICSKQVVLDNYSVKFSQVHKEWVTLFVWPSIKHTSVTSLSCSSCCALFFAVVPVIHPGYKRVALKSSLKPSPCGGLDVANRLLPSCWLSPPFPSRMGKKIGKMGGRKLMGQDKDRKIPLPIMVMAKWREFGRN